jgi:hypothetical protein
VQILLRCLMLAVAVMCSQALNYKSFIGYSEQEYESFRINNDGALEGVGLLIASERDTGRLVSINTALKIQNPD